MIFNINIKNLFSAEIRVFFFSLLMLVLFTQSCNPVYESDSKHMVNALHPNNINGYFHGSLYKYPYRGCDEPNCHNNDLSGGNSGGPSCYTCHTDLWTFFQTHLIIKGGAFHNNNICDPGLFTEKCGTSDCHRNDLSGGRGPACTSCHGSAPNECN